MAANQQFCLRWNNHQSTLISVFDTLLESGTLVDCTLAAEGQSLKAHKVVLSACSPYLESLLSQHYEKHPILILKDVTFTELKAMLDYMYRGEVNICQDQLGQFLKAAESLQIKGLTDNSNNSDLVPPPRKLDTPPRKFINPYSKSPLFPTGLVVEPRPKVNNNNNNSTTNNNNDCAAIPNKPGSDGGSSPKRKRRRKSLDDLSVARDSLEGLYSSGDGSLAPECLVKAEPKFEDVNNENSGDEIPCDADDEEELDLSRPGTSQSGHNSLQPGWNPSGENASDELFPPGQHEQGDDKSAGGFEWPAHILDPKPHICEFCGRSYRYLHNLERHKKMECGKEADKTCPLCPYRSKHKHNLMRHFALRHTPKQELNEQQQSQSLPSSPQSSFDVRSNSEQLRQEPSVLIANLPKSIGLTKKKVPNTANSNVIQGENNPSSSNSKRWSLSKSEVDPDYIYY